MSLNTFFGDNDRIVDLRGEHPNVDTFYTGYLTHPALFEAINTYLQDIPYKKPEIVAEFAVQRYLLLNPFHRHPSGRIRMTNITSDYKFPENPVDSKGKIIKIRYDGYIDWPKKDRFYIEVKHNNNNGFHISKSELEWARDHWPNYEVYKVSIDNGIVKSITICTFNNIDFIKRLINAR